MMNYYAKNYLLWFFRKIARWLMLFYYPLFTSSDFCTSSNNQEIWPRILSTIPPMFSLSYTTIPFFRIYNNPEYLTRNCYLVCLTLTHCTYAFSEAIESRMFDIRGPLEWFSSFGLTTTSKSAVNDRVTSWTKLKKNSDAKPNHIIRTMDKFVE